MSSVLRRFGTLHSSRVSMFDLVMGRPLSRRRWKIWPPPFVALYMMTQRKTLPAHSRPLHLSSSSSPFPLFFILSRIKPFFFRVVQWWTKQSQQTYSLNRILCSSTRMLFNLGLDLSPSATTAVAVEKDNCARLGARGGGDSGPSFAAFANNTRRERGVHLARPLH